MSNKILMPALSPTMTEGNIAKWHVKEGDTIKSGDLIAEIETDKATMEIEAHEDGTISKILAKEGSKNIAINSTIALMNGESAEQEEPEGKAEEEGKEQAEEQTEEKTEEQEATPAKQPEEAKEPSTAKSEADQPTEKEGYITLTVREALRDAMAEEMQRDKRVFLMGEEVGQYQGAYKVSQGLLDRFGPDRVIDTPITEMGFTGVAVGAAMSGMRPILEYMTFNFSMQAIDHIVNSAAKTHYMSGGNITCPIVFRGPNGAASRVAAQHSQCFASWYAHCPGLTVVAPYDADDAKGLLKAAIRNPNPVIFLENEMIYGNKGLVSVDVDRIIPIGKAKVRKEGSDVTIVAFSLMVHIADKAAEELAKIGIDAEVIDLRTLRPLDTDTIIESVKKTNRIVSIEEGWPYAGIGSEIAATVFEKAFDWLDAPFKRVCGADIPMPYAANLEAATLPSVEKLVQAVQKVCG